MNLPRHSMAVASALAVFSGLVLQSASARADGAPMLWQVDKAQSRLGFAGTQTGASFAGTFSRYYAHIDLDPAAPQNGHIDVTIDIASARTGDSQRDTALPGKDWFDTAAFPSAHFVSTTISRSGDNHYLAQGVLTLRGITHPVTLDFTLAVDGQTAHAKGHASLVRTVFGVGQGPWASGQWVGLPVDVTIDFTARHAG